MKKVFVVCFFILFSLGFVLAADVGQAANQTNLTSVGNTLAEKTASLDIFNFNNLQTTITEIVQPLNPFAEVFSSIFFGSSLEFNWTFIITLIFWLVLVLILNGIMGDIFNSKWYFSLLAAIIIAIIVMRGFGDKLELWIGSIANTWYSAIAAIVSACIVYAIYIIFVRPFLSKSRFQERKEEAGKTGKIIAVERDTAKKILDSYKDD